MSPVDPTPADSDIAEPSNLAARRIENLRPFRWRPGQSRNPLGKAGALARRIRQATRQGKELYEVLLAIVRDPKESTKCRLLAAHELFNRGWGKPLAAAVIQHQHSRDNMPRSPADEMTRRLEQLDTEELRQLQAILIKLAVDNPGGVAAILEHPDKTGIVASPSSSASCAANPPTSVPSG